MFPILTQIIYLYMAAIPISEVSKVESHGVWTHPPLHNKAEVRLMPAPCPAHILVMEDKLFSG